MYDVRLTDNAPFSLIIDGAGLPHPPAAVDVVVLKEEEPPHNLTIDDLVEDVNAALALGGVAHQVVASVDEHRMVLRRLGDTGSPSMVSIL